MLARSFLAVLAAALLPVVLAPVRAECDQRALRTDLARSDFRVEILVDGRPVPQYAAGGRRYVEALKGREYAIRIHNPLGVRVAVALSVDGLNTIDARHTSALEARKWVLDPHETVTIAGWQTSLRDARRFYFTSEDRSYAARMGARENIGVISAVFFRERVTGVIPLGIEGAPPAPAPKAGAAGQAAGAAGGQADPSSARREAARDQGSDEYAATGMGARTDHLVRQVHLSLDDTPVASYDVRYEYRAQLARLGILPPAGDADALDRRNGARGFSDFCPVK